MKKLFLIISLLFTFSSVYAKVNVIVSIAPQKTFVDEIGKDLVNTTLLVPIGSNPNFYEPKISQMMAVEKADLYLTIGGHFEKAWLPKIRNQNKQMNIFDCSTGINRIEMKFHKKHKKISKRGLPAKDIHVWLTPKNIEKIGKNIYESLVKLDSKNKKQYKKNYESFLKKTYETDNTIKAILKNTQHNSKFMVFHPAWGYFAKEYHLEQIAIEVEGKEPKPNILTEMIEKARKAEVKAILTQPEFSQKGAKLIANELNINVIAISPLNPKWSKNLINLANAIANKN